MTEVDVVGISAGSLVSRACIANAGRENPETATPGCAALVDDWVGVVPPSHGTTTPGAAGCPWSAPSLCPAITPFGDFQRKLNERYNGIVPDWMGFGDETPQVGDTTPIEYTTFWAGNDGLIDTHRAVVDAHLQPGAAGPLTRPFAVPDAAPAARTGGGRAV